MAARLRAPEIIKVEPLIRVLARELFELTNVGFCPSAKLTLTVTTAGEGQSHGRLSKKPITGGRHFYRERCDHRSTCHGSQHEGAQWEWRVPTEKWNFDDALVDGSISLNGE